MLEDRDQINGERHLWRAVILQALRDATSRMPAGIHQPKRANLVRLAAREWFEAADQDFIEACLRADLDPDAVREAALFAINAPPPLHRRNRSCTSQKPKRKAQH
ncbi:hypothetical protein [Azospirillum sp. SYSU D00513]|uniref:hypothetical protein n=1 Tax=Azospirillum sp. SYSU D00513 TaxID=2812561 RepID=UPI001A96ADE5|nr:hypothetical protein [Azospirillum sp. SYSU D00513]